VNRRGGEGKWGGVGNGPGNGKGREVREREKVSGGVRGKRGKRRDVAHSFSS